MRKAPNLMIRPPSMVDSFSFSSAGAPMPFERGKVYLVGVRKDRDGKGAVLDDVRRLSNTNYAQA